MSQRCSEVRGALVRFFPSFKASEHNSAPTPLTTVAGSIGVSPSVCAMQRYAQALSATESPPNRCKKVPLTCASSTRCHGLCLRLSSCLARYCNRIFVIGCNLVISPFISHPLCPTSSAQTRLFSQLDALAYVCARILSESRKR